MKSVEEVKRKCKGKEADLAEGIEENVLEMARQHSLWIDVRKQ